MTDALDEQYMNRALALAAQGLGRTRPNPVVGCVVVRDGTAVSEGFHRKAGAPHAEIEALVCHSRQKTAANLRGHGGGFLPGASVLNSVNPANLFNNVSTTVARPARIPSEGAVRPANARSALVAPWTVLLAPLGMCYAPPLTDQ